jgi:trigger factor
LNISASDVKDAKLTATVTVEAADVDAAIKKAYKDAAKKYRFPGFRPGKAPRPVVDSMLGAEATLAQATNDIIGGNEAAVLNELDIVPVKEGDYKDIEIAKDHEDYTYTVEFTLRPACELSSYEPVEIEMPPAEVTEAEIDQQVDMLMGYHATFEDVEDRAVEADDYVTADLEDVKGAEQFAGEGRLLAMGNDTLPKEFDEALLGAKIGDEKEISWKPGEDEDECTVKVTVKGIKVRKTPELTDEFAKENFGFDDIAAMRDAIKLELEQDKTAKLPGLKENRAVAKLAERLQLDKMDEDYEKSVFNELGQNFLQNLAQRGMTLDAWLQANGISSDQFISDLHQQANDVARESLALDSLAKHLDVQVNDDDVTEEFKNAGVEDVEASKAEFVSDGRMPAVRDSIRRSKAVDWLVENAKVTEVDEAAEAAKDAE